jgi:hypothetical protein
MPLDQFVRIDGANGPTCGGLQRRPPLYGKALMEIT